MAGTMTVELTYLVWTLGLAIFQILLATVFLVLETGLPYASSPRDNPPLVNLGVTAGRLKRAQNNILETLPIFIGAVLATQVMQIHTSTTAMGVMLYFWARVVYVPVYALGISYLRTAVWGVSLAGIIMVLTSLF